jgi:hypothetical protein
VDLYLWRYDRVSDVDSLHVRRGLTCHTTLMPERAEHHVRGRYCFTAFESRFDRIIGCNFHVRGRRHY